MSAYPFTADQMYAVLESYQKAQLHLAALERAGKRPSAIALAQIAGVSLQCAKREIRRQRKTQGSHATPGPAS